MADSCVLVFCAHQPFRTPLSLRDQERLGARLAPQARQALWYALLQLRIRFPFLSFSIFRRFDSKLPSVASVSSGLRKSLISSPVSF